VSALVVYEHSARKKKMNAAIAHPQENPWQGAFPTRKRWPVPVSILDNLYQLLPRPPYTEQDTDEIAECIYEYVRERSTAETG
jgi:hypothetical protein